jgi:homogentisate phytyltransferase/homogentisate geranylgeranyltransferase
MKFVTTLWKFSRPHTIIGSVISIFTLFTIICHERGHFNVFLFIMAIGMGITCNLFIVGINQVADVELDKINKPSLPIPSGILSVQQAMLIVWTSAGISLMMALYLSPYLFGIIFLAIGIGWAYSMPPLHLKQHHIPAALAIATVRGILLNAGGFLVFNHLINHTMEMPLNIKILTVFVILFSVVIAWFKDLPDIEGDARFHIQSLAIRYSPKTTVITGHLLVGSAYLFTIYMQFINYKLSDTPSFETKALLFGHIMLLLLFIFNAFSIRINQHSSVQQFYKRFWWFFFAEYLLYLIAYTI